MPHPLIVSVAYGLVKRVRGRPMHPPTSHFKIVFDVYNFSTFSKLFCSSRTYAFSTYIENVRTKGIISGEALRIRVKNFKQNLRENYSKSTKIIITACKFSKFFQVSMPADSPKAFSVSQSASNLFCRKKIRLRKVWKLWPPPLSKFLATPLRRDESDRCSVGPH